MGLNEVGLSAKAKAFSVDNLLKTATSTENKIAGEEAATNAVASGTNFITEEHSNKISNEKSVCRRIHTDKGVAVELCGTELWEKFHKLGTEMIVTKAGRRMFPTLKFRFHGLSMSSSYIVYMDVIPVGTSRYRYIYESSQWTTAGTRENTNLSNQLYLHPDSPATGQLWTSQSHVSFDKVKLSNNIVKCPIVRGQISLHSLHKYQPRIHVLKAPPDLEASDVLTYITENRQDAASFVYPETKFIAVTAYHNQEITKLKIRNNPFAKGFRDPTLTRYNIKKQQPDHKIRFLPYSKSIKCKCCLSHQRVPVKIVIPFSTGIKSNQV